MSTRNEKFVRLMSAMGSPKESANLLIDDETSSRLKKEQELAKIDDKITQLEESDDPNALESINFWKKRKEQLLSK